MILKTRNFFHEEENIHRALGVDNDTMIKCRERIFFCHFANTLQSIDLFNDVDLAPRELTTVTGDLKRCLEMISNEVEYEITLLHFMSYHRLAQEAFAHWKFENDPENSKEDKLKLELFKMLKKLKDAREKENDPDSNDLNSDLHDTDDIVKRIDQVKKSNYNFQKYMEAMGYKLKSHNDVDDMLNNLFTDH
jgi:hypothetical protein